MHTESIDRWVHDHTFGQDEKKSAERRTLIVSVVTILTMIVEIGAGIAIVSSRPLDPDEYYKLLPVELGLVHVTVETHRCAAHVREAL
ncbi:MAG: hypothetical protein NUV51_06785 [Sulfuricaulis sp.]|nr:hypothetical protein [Sulfuricaulis sp.]